MAADARTGLLLQRRTGAGTWSAGTALAAAVTTYVDSPLSVATSSSSRVVSTRGQWVGDPSPVVGASTLSVCIS